MRRVIVPVAPSVDLTEIATRARYVGSAEHKSFPSFAGAPKLRADATKCDPSLSSASEITAWIRAGIADGCVGGPWDGEFPRYVWRRVDGICYEGRLVNRDAGTYKGYSLREYEAPQGI